ncbi:MAG: PAS domain-containing protein [Methanospirillum sp.]|uniref:PAS domain-containing protein n=1 Tax=Methanospirillum sp. TaxID=45200 RepID=UPI00236D9ED2|nr:PAS domain-containing protein [Methanospirillum sp.]MDD1729982.1 PAS domain-containing protein [Methanospirillum sp.]
MDNTEWERIFNAIPDMVSLIGPDHRIQKVNTAMADHLGVTPDEVIGMHCFEIVHGTSNPIVTCPHTALILDKKEHASEIYNSINQRFYHVSCTPLFTSDESPVVSIHIIRDITEQQQRENKIIADNAFIQLLMDTIPNPIFYKDTEGRYLGSNGAWDTLIGVKKEEILGKTVHDILPEEFAHEHEIRDTALLITGGSVQYEAQIPGPDGKIHDIIMNKAVFSNETGAFAGIVGIIIDFTDRKRLENAIMETNRKLSILSSITRHDILNSITALTGYLEFSREKCTSPEQEGFLSKSAQLTSIIQRQIEFTRMYQDVGIKPPEWQLLSGLIGRAMKSLDLTGINVENKAGCIEIYAEPLIEKVFFNLMENSLRHGGTISRITVTTENDRDSLKIIYTDDGSGISEADKKRLFTKGFGKNTGLGLFLSREILAITKMTITETGIPGNGVRFEISVSSGSYRMVPNDIEYT